MHSQKHHEKPRPTWRKAPLEEELIKLQQVSSEDQRVAMHINDLAGLYKIAKLENLNPEDWNDLENTSSRDPNWTLKQIIQYKGGEPFNKDVQRIINGIEAGIEIPAPIILFRQGKPPYVIAGDTRLLVCRAMGIIPKIIAIRP